jgi:hypothetical protein
MRSNTEQGIHEKIEGKKYRWIVLLILQALSADQLVKHFC